MVIDYKKLLVKLNSKNAKGIMNKKESKQLDKLHDWYLKSWEK